MKDVTLNQDLRMESGQGRPTQIVPATPQLLMLLPFELLLKYLEAVILHEFEVACRLYSESARGLDNAFMTHIDKFEVTVRDELNKIYSAWR